MLGNYLSQVDLAVGDQIDGQQQGAGTLKLAIFVQTKKTVTAIEFQFLWSICRDAGQLS